MDKKDLKAILLDDPDENIFNALRDKLLEQGIGVISDLEDAWENTTEEILQSRIDSIIQTIQFEDVKNKLYSWKNNNEENLLYGVYLLAKFQYPEINYDDIIKKRANIIENIYAIKDKKKK